MTTLTLDLEQFTSALTTTVNRSLPWTWLNPTSFVDDEPTPPSFVDPVPSVMSSYVLVPSLPYRFSYKNIRYARFCYLLERDHSYEAGELSVIHDLIITATSPMDETVPPPIHPVFTPPTITTSQTVSIGGVGSLGVLLSFTHDPSTNGGTEQFGLSFKITNNLPAVFPRISMAYVTAITPEEEGM